MSAPPPPAAPTKAKPGAMWIVLAIVLIVIGPGGCSAFAVVRLFGAINDADAYGRFQLPVHNAQVVFPKATSDAAIQSVVSSGTPPDIRASLTGPDGRVQLIQLENARVLDARTSGAKHRVREVARFTVTTPGTYRLSAEAESGRDVQLWVGHRIDLGGRIGIVVVLGFVVFVGGIVMLIVVLVRRRRSRRLMQAGAAGYGPGYPGGYPPGYPGGPAGYPGGPPPPAGPSAPAGYPPPPPPSNDYPPAPPPPVEGSRPEPPPSGFAPPPPPPV